MAKAARKSTLICKGCMHWVPGISCIIGQSPTDCEQAHKTGKIPEKKFEIPELGDCPYCGGKAIIVSNPGHNWDDKMGKEYTVGGCHGLWYVGCPYPFFESSVPNCEIRPSASWFASLERAIEAWNHRVGTNSGSPKGKK